MALINCPECGKEISDKAIACINCGFPVSEVSKLMDTEPFPELPNDLNIGAQIVNWTGDAGLYVKYYSDNKFSDFTNGKYEICLHKHGLCISQDYKTKLIIHQSQIIDIYEYKDVVSVDGDIVSNALVGGILFGVAGAIVGGMAGSGKKQINGDIICIKFWDIPTQTKVVLCFLANQSPTKFINRCKEELSFRSEHTSIQDTVSLTATNNGCLTTLIIAIIILAISFAIL